MNKIVYSMAGLYLNSLAFINPKKGGESGFGLFCRPFRSKIKAHQMKFLHSAERFYHPYHGLDIQMYKWGEGPIKVIFLHGWQSHTFRWKKYIESMPSDRFTVYALDAPGHGLSAGRFLTVPLYAELIQSIVENYGKFDAAVAHSLGGMSLLYALSHYEALPIDKAVVMGVPGKVSEFFEFYEKELQLNTKAMTAIRKHFESQIGNPITYYETENFIRKVKIPGLIIHDKYDSEAPYFYAERFHQQWKNSEILTTEGLGHNLKSQEVVEKIMGFLS